MGKIQDMIDYAVAVARDDSHGYSQVRRWPEDGTDFDCSSLMYEAADHAGYEVKRGWPRYTGSMLDDFTAAGFEAIRFDGNLGDLDPGDIMLNVGAHTEMYIGNGQFVGAHIAETGGVDGAPGDQTGNEISICPAYVYSSGWDYVLMPPRDVVPIPDSSDYSTTLDGIDIASWQAGIDIASVDADFVIVKATGGTSYVNPYWREWANATLASGKMLGLYHFACEYDGEPGGKAEAEFFLSQVSDFIGKAVFCLDWEAHATGMPVSYAKAWLDTVADRTGSTPMFYGYASNVNSTDYSAISGYPLWMASYLDRYSGGSGYVDNPANNWDTGAWRGMTIYQYSSTRTIRGYSGNLDVNVFYGSMDDWEALANGSGGVTPTPRPSGDESAIHFRASIDPSGRSWLDEMWGHYDTGGSGDWFAGIPGVAMRWIAIKGVKRYRVATTASGWLPWVDQYNVNDLDQGCAGDGSPIIALQVDDPKARYCVGVVGGPQYSDMVGLRDLGGSGDDFAGDMVNPIDRLFMNWA